MNKREYERHVAESMARRAAVEELHQRILDGEDVLCEKCGERVSASPPDGPYRGMLGHLCPNGCTRLHRYYGPMWKPAPPDDV